MVTTTEPEQVIFHFKNTHKAGFLRIDSSLYIYLRFSSKPWLARLLSAIDRRTICQF